MSIIFLKETYLHMTKFKLNANKWLYIYFFFNKINYSIDIGLLDTR